MTIPPPDPLALAALAAAVTSGTVHVHYPRCRPCLAGDHVSPPAPHPWVAEADITKAKSQDRPEPSGLCGCPCAHGVEVGDE